VTTDLFDVPGTQARLVSAHTRNGKRQLRAAIYTRISDDRTGEGAGVKRQREACDKLAAERGVDVVAYFEDNSRSAMHGVRPQYAAMLAAVERHEIDVIICWAVDRLYRQLADLLELTKVLSPSGVVVWTVVSGRIDLSTPDGQLQANILGSVAEHESKKKGQRVREAAEQRAGKGRFGGGQRRFGYRHRDTRIVRRLADDGMTVVEVERPGGPLVLVRDEADAIGWAYNHILRGGTLEAVVREWRGRGLVGPQGARFSGVAVRDVLLRPMNAGLTFYLGSEVGETIHDPKDDPIPTITDEQTWRAVKAILTHPDRRTTVGKPPTSLLAGVLRCVVCEGRMTARTRRRPDKTKDPIYACRIGHVSRVRPKLDAAIESMVVAHLVKNAAALRRPATSASGAVAKAVRDAEKLRDRLAGYHASAADMDPADYATATQAVRARLADVEKRIVASSGSPATSALVRSDDIPATWAALDTDEQRTVIKENVSRIEVGHGVSGARDKTMHNVRVYDRDGKLVG
jgi:site-specific DNA recombinase